VVEQFTVLETAPAVLWQNCSTCITLGKWRILCFCKRIRISPKPKHAIAESDVAAMTRPTVVNNDDIIKAKEGSTRWNETARGCTLKAHELKSRDARRQHLVSVVWWKWPLEDSPQMIGISARRSWRHAPHVPHPVLPGAMVAHQTALLSISLIL
jgi:hypothetical protein